MTKLAMSEPVSILGKLKSFSGIGSFVLAAAIAFSGWIGHSAVNTQVVQTNSKAIESLQEQVRGLQVQVEQQKVLEQQISDVKEQGQQTQSSIDRLADELHAWQREERLYHRSNK